MYKSLYFSLSYINTLVEIENSILYLMHCEKLGTNKENVAPIDV